MHLRLVGPAVALVVLGGSAAVLAEPGSESGSGTATDSPEIRPPEPITTVVPAPIDPEKTTLVLLELLIDAEGHVEQAKALEGPEPFRTAALTAASDFRFEPARRLGRPVASRIRFLVRFEPPSPLPGPEPATSGRPEPSSSKAPERPGADTVEVVVSGVRPAYTTGVITRAEARELPGTFGDPLRAVEASTGVMPIFSGVPFFFVRGAPPGNVGVFLDGIRVPFLYHALLGPSVVHPALIERVDLHRGAAPAQYGRYAGAIITAETREPLSRLGGEGNVRIFDAGGLVETPFADGRGHVLLGGRYSYTALVASLISGANLNYWDYQARGDIATGDHSRLGVFTFGAFDLYETDDESDASATKRGAGTQFHRIDVRHDIKFGGTSVRVATTMGYDRTGSPAGYLSDRVLGVRSLVEQKLDGTLTLTAGHDVTMDVYELDLDLTSADADDLSRLFPARTDLNSGVHAELAYSPAPFVSVAPGARVDAYRVGSETIPGVDLRWSSAWHPGAGIHAHQSLGLSHQSPNYVPQVPAASVGTLKGGLQEAIQASSGLSFDLPLDLKLAATAFHARFRDLLDPIGSARDLSFDPESINRRERGSSIGLELELHRALTQRIGGFLGYTLSRTERTNDVRNSLAAFDRTHVVQGALAIDLGRHWRAGTRAVYYSGIPGRMLRPNSQDTYFSNAQRSAPFFRVDLRLEKRWPIAGRGYWALVAEMLNATLSREITRRDCTAGGCDDEGSGPVAIPSVGLEFYSY